MPVYINEYIIKKKLDKPIDSESFRGRVTVNSEHELVKIIKEEFEKSADNVVDLNFIDVSNLDNMWGLFRDVAMACRVGIRKLRNVDISKWNVSNVRYFKHTFFDYANFDCDLSGWDVHNLENAEMMFCKCTNFKGTGLDKWDVSNLKVASSMFSSCINLNVDLSNWKTSKINSIDRMFYKCSNMNFDASNWDVSNIRNAYGVFGYCNPMNINVENWNLSNVQNINAMFEGCKKFNHDLSNWKIHSTVYNRRNMFKNCKLPKKYMPEFIKL